MYLVSVLFCTILYLGIFSTMSIGTAVPSQYLLWKLSVRKLITLVGGVVLPPTSGQSPRRTTHYSFATNTGLIVIPRALKIGVDVEIPPYVMYFIAMCCPT
jgi:hypothetical protein